MFIISKNLEIITKVLLSFIVLFKDKYCYIQGLDSLTCLAISEFPRRPSINLAILEKLYDKFIKHFIDAKTQTARFQYPVLIIKRLLNFFSP